MGRTSVRSGFALLLVGALAAGTCTAPAASAPPGSDAPQAATTRPIATQAAGPTDPPAATPTVTAELSGPVVPADVLAANTTPHPVHAIAVGRDVCAIREDGSVGCWGYTTATPPEGRLVALDNGDRSTCAIREDGTLACWGEIGGEVPDGAYTSVSVTYDHACAIRRDNASLECWRQPSDDSDEDGFEIAEPPTGPFTAVSVGEVFDCALRGDGELACWSQWPDDDFPVPNSGRRYLALDVPCAIQFGGTLECFDYWDGSEPWSESGSRPPVEGAYRAVSATTYGGRGCALRVDGTLRCWGDEGWDDDSGKALAMRTPIGSYKAVSVGDKSACATRPDGIAVCWGEYDETARPAPTMWLEAPLFVTDLKIPLRWGARPAFGAITTYDIDRVTGWDEDEGFATGFESWRAATTTTSGTVEGKPGEEVCWRARAHDIDGRTSDWTGDCTTLPHDDTAFERSEGWSTVRDSRYYLGRATTATTRGATLTINVGDDAYGLALFATTCPSCGRIEVIMDGEVYDTVSLKTAKRHDLSLVWSADEFEGAKLGVKVVSKDRPVTIDALLQGPSLDEEGWVP